MSIQAKNLSFQYAEDTPFETNALHNISFTIQKGEFVGIMGHTGSGKSTLLQLLCGLLKPTGGIVYIDGENICNNLGRQVLQKKVGIVFQYPENQLFESTVEKDVAYGLRHTMKSKSEIEKQVRWALESMGFSFENVRHLSPLALSGGEKRRVAIAGILATQPDYLLLDEPIAGLDAVVRQQFMALLKRLNQEGMTILMISHNPDYIAEYTKRLLVLENGYLIADNTTKNIFSDIDWMQKHQLEVSQCRSLVHKLQQCGWTVDSHITTYKELLDFLQNALKGVI